MYETILYDFANSVLGRLGAAMVDQVKFAMGVEDELEKLQRNLSAIKAVLQDAERQQTASASVRDWLDNLEQIVYEIDNVLDEIAFEAALKESVKGDPSWKVTRLFSRSNPLTFRFQLAHQIKDVCKRLDEIASLKNQFLFNFAITSSSETISNDPRETHSKVRIENILGREKDKEEIMSLVLGCSDCEGLSVIPVVGLGGVGKTALAKLVYNDGRIEKYFDIKMWVYVSQNCSTKKILGKITQMVFGEHPWHMSIEEMSSKLSERLKDKKYFLILDDWWDESPNDWSELRELLDMGSNGSTIVMTTRSARAAVMMKTIEKHHSLEGLSSEICLEIFNQLAFGNECNEKQGELVHFVKMIVEKSGGIPLIITVLGKLLKGVTDESEWQHVIQKLESGHEDILRILKLSYDQLPSHLKKIFILFSLQTNGFETDVIDLQLKWMALGAFQSNNQLGGPPELLSGKKYLEELAARSLLTELEYIYCGQLIRECNMHDFVHDLAKSLVAHELGLVKCATDVIDHRAKHIVFTDGSLSGNEFPKAALKAKKARSVQIRGLNQSLPESYLKKIIANFKSLRLLDLACCDIKKLPKAIGYLKHLRYLNLSGNKQLQQLPDSLWYLLNLQTLDLEGCSQLKEVPESIGSLKSLQALNLTSQQEYLPESLGLLVLLRILVLENFPRLVCLPRNLNNLKALQCLTINNCPLMDLSSDSSIYSIGGLSGLKILQIFKLPNFKGLPSLGRGSITGVLMHSRL